MPTTIKTEKLTSPSRRYSDDDDGDDNDDQRYNIMVGASKVFTAAAVVGRLAFSEVRAS